MGTNHYCHFVLTTKLLPLLIKTQGSRVVNVSSMMHKYVSSAISFQTNIDGDQGYDAWGAYGKTKLSNLLFTFELQRRLRTAGHQFPLVLAAHPGYTETNLQFADKSAFMKGAMAVSNFIFAQSVQDGGEH